MEGKYVAFKYYARECLHDVSGQLEISWFSLQYYPSSFTTIIHCYPPFTTTHSLHHLLERNGIQLICTGSEHFSLCNNTIATLPPMLKDVVTPLSRCTIALHTKLATRRVKICNRQPRLALLPTVVLTGRPSSNRDMVSHK